MADPVEPNNLHNTEQEHTASHNRLTTMTEQEALEDNKVLM